MLTFATEASRAKHKFAVKRNNWPKTRGVAMNPVDHPHGGVRFPPGGRWKRDGLAGANGGFRVTINTLAKRRRFRGMRHKAKRLVSLLPGGRVCCGVLRRRRNKRLDVEAFIGTVLTRLARSYECEAGEAEVVRWQTLWHLAHLARVIRCMAVTVIHVESPMAHLHVSRSPRGTAGRLTGASVSSQQEKRGAAMRPSRGHRGGQPVGGQGARKRGRASPLPSPVLTGHEYRSVAWASGARPWAEIWLRLVRRAGQGEVCRNGLWAPSARRVEQKGLVAG